MSMLSIEDLYQEIGKNIFICPLHVENFRDNSIDLTASEFAWNSDDGSILYHEDDDTIKVPPHVTACILTRESIFVTEKIGGTYHSRVSLVKQGFGHIGTMLDPKYCGQSLIALQNITDHEIAIKGIRTNRTGIRIVSVVFDYVKTPIYEESLSTPPSHIDKISKMDKDGSYAKWLDNNQWVNNPHKLKVHFKECYEEEFKRKKSLYAQKKSFWLRAYNNKIVYYLVKYFLLLALGIGLYMVVKKFFANNSSDWAAIIVAIVLFVLAELTRDIHDK